MIRLPLLLTTCAVLLAGCYPEKQETTTRGHLTVYLTESAAPVLIEEVRHFLDLYGADGANIDYKIMSTEEAVREFIDDTVRCIFTVRALKPGERLLATRTPEDRLTEIAVAHDGIVVVVHYKNSIERITVDELRNILTGAYTRWEQLRRSGGMQGRIGVIYHDSSDVSWYLEQRLLKGKPLRKDVLRTTSSLQTLRGIVDQPLSIACVGLSWIDSARVPAKVLEVAETANPSDTTYQLAPESIGRYYEPHPAHIYRKFYPLRRTIYIYARAPIASFASGFTTFVSNRDGQRIFLDRNLVPGTQPIQLRAPQ
ncbi:MAG: hypothetical protein FJ217_08135 [Ignavibacteria bacterium]|nr:hypothetical protein [Ignavibacteria bacterium]